MNRAIVVFLAFAFCSCERNEATKPDPASAQSKEAPAPSAERKEPAAPSEPGQGTPSRRISLPVAEFQSQLVEEGLSPILPRVPLLAEKELSASDLPEQLQFTRVAGGPSRYCGTLGSGPIQCWGKDPTLLKGSFADVALADEGYCGIDLNGKLKCEKLAPPQGVFEQVVANGKNYCALARGGAVHCFGRDGTPPQENQRAKYITVGAKFACAADPTDRLLCWGQQAPLLPIDLGRVKDIAAGRDFLCLLSEDGKNRCFGAGPRLPEHSYAAVNAGSETVCGITADGEGYCSGRVDVKTAGPVRRFAVGDISVCAHRQDGKLECWGDEASGQLRVPTATRAERALTQPPNRKAAPRVNGALWLQFIELFPRQDPPLTFDEKASVSLGDRVPPTFEPLLGSDPNRFRVGVGVQLAHQTLGLTLFDLEERALFLFLYQDRTLVDSFELVRWSYTAAAVEEHEDGTAVGERLARARRTLITSPSTLEVALFEGRESSTFVKRHQDGSRPVSSTRCEIDKTSFVLRLLPSGEQRRDNAHVARDYGAVDKEGCGSRFPFRAD